MVMKERQELSQMSMAELIELVLGLKTELRRLKTENAQFKEENKRLKQELAVLKKPRSSLR